VGGVFGEKLILWSKNCSQAYFLCYSYVIRVALIAVFLDASSYVNGKQMAVLDNT